MKIKYIFDLFKNYIPDNIKLLLLSAGVSLFLIDIKKISIIFSSENHNFKDALLNDTHLKNSLKNIIQSLVKSQQIIQICMNINKKYYNISFYYEHKKKYFIFKRKYVYCLVNDITSKVQTHYSIQNAYEEQLRINKMKTAFLSRMSHEFRTPLNAVIGFSDAMKHKLYGNISDEYIEYVNNIHEAGSHLLDIVNDIMDISYFEHRNIVLNLTYFSPILAINNILKFIHSLLAQQKIIINLSHDLPDDFMINNDFNVFKRIFINIIGNATKYCPEYTQLDVKISLVGQYLSIYIRDYGDGFPDSVIKNFGIPFNVGDNFLTNTNSSIGLGLSIVKTAIQAMRGAITIYNHIEKGAVISFTIPIDVSNNYSDDTESDSGIPLSKRA